LLIEMNDHVDKPLIAEIMEQLNLPSGGGSVPALGLLQEQLSDVSNSLTLRYFSLLEKRMHHRDFSLLSNTP